MSANIRHFPGGTSLAALPWRRLAQALGMSVEALLKQSIAAYLPQAQAELTCEPIGFGRWADRPEMQDAAKWVDDLRTREWAR